MNKLISKIVGACLGLSLATGVGVGVAVGKNDFVKTEAADQVCYTLNGTTTGGTSGYDTESDITQGDILWKATGNTTMNPWRIGGKNLSGVDRTIYSTTAMTDSITKVVVTHGAASSITINSFKLVVSSNSNFSSPTSTLTGTFAANNSTTFNCPSGTSWAGKYFKLIYNVSVSGSSNRFIEFKKAEFYKDNSGGTSYPEPTMVSGTLSQLFANTDGNGKQLYEVTGFVSNWKSGESNGTQYGNFYLTETLGGSTEYYIYGATATAASLSWDSSDGIYKFSNPKDFLTDTLTKRIDIGAQVTMKLTRCDYNSTPEATGIVTAVVEASTDPKELGSELIILPDYLGLTTTGITAETSFRASDNYTYVAAPGGSNSVKKTTFSNPSSNAFDSGKTGILMGKGGAYLYNSIAYAKKISKFELYAPTGASAAVSVAVAFANSNDGPITTDISSTSNKKTLSTLDSVYDFSISGMLSSNYTFFRVQVCNGNNAQLQIKITFADDSQQAIDLNSITLSHADLVNGVLPIGKGANKTLSVSFDPTDASDQTLTWSTSNDQIATVDNGVITVSKTAALNSTATITATPTDTHASAKSITVKVVDAVAKTVDMRNGIDNSADNRLQLTTSQGLSSWPNNAIKVTLTDDSELYPSYNDSKIVWYYNTSDSGTNDIQIDDIASFVFNTSIKRMRLSYDGVLATARTFVTVVEASSDASDFADLFLETLSTGNNATCNAQGNTNLNTLKSDWETLAGMFDALSDGDKTLFTDGQGNETGTNIQKALALYDYIASKYNTQLETETLTDYNFMGRTLSSGARPMINIFNVSNNAAVPAIVLVIALATVTAGAYFFLRKKKEN